MRKSNGVGVWFDVGKVMSSCSLLFVLNENFVQRMKWIFENVFCNTYVFTSENVSCTMELRGMSVLKAAVQEFIDSVYAVLIGSVDGDAVPDS